MNLIVFCVKKLLIDLYQFQWVSHFVLRTCVVIVQERAEAKSVRRGVEKARGGV